MKKKIIIGLALIAWAKPLNCADPERIPRHLARRRVARGLSPAQKKRAAAILRELSKRIHPTPVNFPQIPPRVLKALPLEMRKTIGGYQANWNVIKADPRNIAAIIAHLEQEASKLTAEPAVVVPPRRRAPRAVPAATPAMPDKRVAAILFRLAREMAKPTPPVTFPMPRKVFVKLPTEMKRVIQGYKDDWARIRTNNVRRAEIAQNLVEKATELTAEPAAFVPPRRHAPRAVPVVTPAAEIPERREVPVIPPRTEGARERFRRRKERGKVPGWMEALTTEPLIPLPAKEATPEEVGAERERALMRQRMRKAAEERARIQQLPEAEVATMIFDAIKKGDTEQVIRLVQIHPLGLNVTNNLGYPPLMVAAEYGRLETARALLERGVKVDEGPKGWTPLIAAAARGHAPVVALLLAHDAEIDHVDNEFGQTALMYAVESRREGVVGLLIGYGADRTKRNKHGQNVLDIIGAKQKELEQPELRHASEANKLARIERMFDDPKPYLDYYKNKREHYQKQRGKKVAELYATLAETWEQ